MGSKRVSVSRTAGHTKWAQTIPVLPKSLHLLDTPGLVFPALLQPPTLPATVTTEQLQMVRDEERAIQECCGVLPLAQVREPYSAVRFLAQHLPLEVMYGLRLPKVSTQTHIPHPCYRLVRHHFPNTAWLCSGMHAGGECVVTPRVV